MATTSLNPGVGPTNADIATAVAAPSAATIASAVAAPSAATIATAVAAAVPTTAGITTIVQSNAGGKTMKRLTLTSGTSYTVPAGVTFLNVTLFGGGGAGGGYDTGSASASGSGGTTSFTGATSASGGTGALNVYSNGQGSGTNAQANSFQGGTGFTRTDGTSGRTVGGKGVAGSIISSTLSVTPGATISYAIGAGGTSTANTMNGGSGGSGKIDVEYWS